MTNEIICKNSNDVEFEFPVLVQTSINNIVEDEGYVKYTVKKRQLPTDGNFVGLLYEVDIIGETAEGAKETSLFIKQQVFLAKITMANVPQLYSRELFVYSDLSKVYSRLQDEAKVPLNERFNILKHYKSCEEVIIMENLGKKGFETYPRTKVASIKFAELSIIGMAKFHALSFVVREKIPKYFEDKIKSKRNIFNLDSDWQGFINNICKTTAKVLTGEVKTKIQHYGPRIYDLYKKYLQDTVPRNGCICHGDYKMPNILVKEVDGEASEICLIDYQMVYYGCPVDDIFHFIFSGTDREFRRKHLNYLKELYFESFAKFLKYFDMDVNSTYSREEFEKDYQERFELGLVFGLYLSAFTFAHIEEGFDVSKLSLSELPLIPDEMFEDRVRGIVDDYTEWGYL